MRIPIQQLRGAKDLLEDVVRATVNASESLQQKIVRQPYALLQRIDAIAAPVRKIESVQATITQTIYGTIRFVTRGSVGLASRLLDFAERNAWGRK
ncbi:hypothetical protein ELE36_09600 [Pseudolysobacter antarcticus]|uniref:Uncharacterized protein n=1 Tax=Pseudolysobacter antarcticus TaxID=2511995 RepID=A0A411HJD8_9GAMM|nr:hypothetical protein [Pseudolysobacter antarcticus]QBB70601.1 hypothetical protein ELE36_09600 [Pseudolysobacter antarcticus]